MKKIFLSLLLISLPLFLPLSLSAQSRTRLALDGQWQFALDPLGSLSINSPFSDLVSLPGTTDTNRKGVAIKDTTETTHLSRLFSYKGKAWYSRNIYIDKSWKNHTIILHLERTKTTTIFVDGKLCGGSNDVSTPQTFDLSKVLTPGQHTLTILVDNGSGVPEQVYASSHAYTEDTQTNWNGIIGQLYLEAIHPTHFTDLQVRTDIEHPTVAQVTFRCTPNLKRKDKIIFSVIDTDGDKEKIIAQKSFPIASLLHEQDKDATIHFDLSETSKRWSEFHPNLFRLKAEIVGKDIYETTFGLTKMETRNHHFYVNDTLTFLRGKHDACVWPQTGHVAMKTDDWKEYLTQLSTYGINHIRFHSWCPPEAAFQAADELGFYLQPELPFWGDFKAEDSTLMTFLLKEGKNIIRTYGHHPSFQMMALGNELWGSIEAMKQFVDTFRKMAPEKLYTFGSNFYLGYQGIKPGMDYFTTCRIGGEGWGNYNTHTRGSFAFADVYDGGMLNHFYPNSTRNFDLACDAANVPVISHETGQFQTYPDFETEIPEYKGVLYPYNMMTFQRRLQKAGLADMAKVFHDASGKWAVQLYKADIEMDLRTKNMAGFQLLDIQDYPGQGSAYVGILDANMQTKGITTQDEWKQWCYNTVILAELPKFCFSDETILADIKIANYSGASLKGKNILWGLSRKNGNTTNLSDTTIVQGQLTVNSDAQGLISVGTICIPQAKNLQSGRYSLTLTTASSDNNEEVYRNNYSIWVYPSIDKAEAEKGKVLITSTLNDAVANKLKRGAVVLWMPDSTTFANDSALYKNTVGGLFLTDYWNWRMFKTISENNKKPVSPGTLGLYIANPLHPIFADFPTDSYTSWQWFDATKNSRPLMLDNLDKKYRPIVQVIDNIERNHRLGLIFEFQVGKGKLMVCMTNLRSKLPETKALYRGILRYMNSDAFAPATQISWEELKKGLTDNVDENQLKELNNISQY